MHRKRFGYKEILAGFISGTIVALTIMSLSYLDPTFSNKPLGFHAGLWGLVVNMIIVIIYNRRLAINDNNS